MLNHFKTTLTRSFADSCGVARLDGVAFTQTLPTRAWGAACWSGDAYRRRILIRRPWQGEGEGFIASARGTTCSQVFVLEGLKLDECRWQMMATCTAGTSFSLFRVVDVLLCLCLTHYQGRPNQTTRFKPKDFCSNQAGVMPTG